MLLPDNPLDFHAMIVSVSSVVIVEVLEIGLNVT